MGTVAYFYQFGPYFNAGVLVSAIKVFHYIPGTTTTKAAWSDRDKTTQVAQPLIGDANGVATLYGDGLYDFLITDSASATLYTFNNVETANNTYVTFTGQETVSNKVLSTLRQLNENVVFVDNYTSFENAITTIGATVTTLIVNKRETISANVTVPETLSLIFMGQGDLSINAGITVTINGFIQADRRKIFQGSGVVSFAGNNVLREVYPEWWGATGDGVTDDRAAIQAAITAMQTRVVNGRGGGEIVFTSPAYLIIGTTSPDTRLNGIVIPMTGEDNDQGTPKRLTLRFHQGVRLLAGSDGMVVIRLSDSHCSIIGYPVISANAHLDVWGLGLVPEDMAQTTTVVFQAYNHIEVVTRDCDEGIVLAGGPQVAGRDSGVWYNDIYHFGFGNKRGLWLKAATTASSVVNNRNRFYGRVGQGGNTGIQIDSGSANEDFTHYEGVNVGTSPNAMPTAVKVILGPAAGADNSDNRFYGHFEACTRWVENANNSTSLLGPVIDESKSVFTVRPIVILGRRVDGTTVSRLTVSVIDGYGGILGFGTTVTGGATSGDTVYQFQHGPRGVTAAGTNTQPLIRLTTNDWVELSPGGAVVLFSGEANMQNVNTRIKVLPTASLPAPGAAQDGLIMIEDVGAGDRNLIIYAGGQRFRIDGGAAF